VLKERVVDKKLIKGIEYLRVAALYKRSREKEDRQGKEMKR